MIKHFGNYILLIGLLFAMTTTLAIAASEITGDLSTGVESSGDMDGVVKTAPTASPVAETYHATQSVSLTASGSTAICYTTDDTTPACNGTSACTTGDVYSPAISVALTDTIKSIACYADSSYGDVSSDTYTLTCTTASVTNGSVAAYPGCAVTCNSGYTLSGSTCAASGGGGGGGGGATGSTATPMPITTNGIVTVTKTGGGKTTLTDSDGTKATVTVPANTVSYASDFQINAVEQTSSAVSGIVVGVGSGQSIVGNLYNFTAQSGSSVLKVFSKTLTITMTYTSAQIAGLNESDLKIYYWDTDTSAWIALSCTIDKANNTITATTDHFTYFAVMTGAGTGEEGGEVTGGETETTDTVDGDVVRAPDASGMDQFDVYIVKLINGKKFRRLVLSPHVFESYGHLQWGNIKDISNTQMQTYEISNIIRCYDPTEGVNDPKVYRLYPDGDSGAKRWMNMAANKFGASYDWDSIYFINKVDRDAYMTGENLTS